jgi:hypothetical protein
VVNLVTLFFLNLAIRGWERSYRRVLLGDTLLDAIHATWDPVQPRRGTR